MKTIETNIIVAFHIGRGGRFYNAGHKTFIGERPISDFVEDLFVKYTGHDDVVARFNNSKIKAAVQDALVNNDLDTLTAFGVTAEDLGELEYVDLNQSSVGLTVSQAETGIGSINIDNEYDTTYTRLLSDCDASELEIIANSKGYKSSELEDFLKANHN